MWSKGGNPDIAEDWEDRDTNPDYWWNRIEKNYCPLCMEEGLPEDWEYEEYLDSHIILSGDEFFSKKVNKGKRRCWKHLEGEIRKRYIDWFLRRMKVKYSCKGFELSEIDFPEGNYFWESHLEGTNLWKAHLEGAFLGGIHLQESDLRGAHLEKAHLRFAHMEKAFLWKAHLEGADLLGAHLEGAFLGDAHIEGADFWGAILANGEMILSRNDDENNHIVEKLGDIAPKDFKLSPSGSADFLNVHYRRDNWYFRFAFAWLISLFLFPFKLLINLFKKKNPLKPNLAQWKFFRRTRFIGVDISWVDWTNNRQLEKDIIYQQYLHQIYNKNNIIKPIYFAWWLFTNCGQSLWRWLFWCAAIISVFAILFYQFPQYTGHPLVTERFQLYGNSPIGKITLMDDDPSIPSLLTAFYFSVTTFTTFGLGDIVPCCDLGKIFVTIEMILGFVMLGGLISLFATKVVRQ